MEGKNNLESRNANRKIKVDDPFDLHFWAYVLKCDAGQLKNAVAAVGDSLNDVKRYLGR